MQQHVATKSRRTTAVREVVIQYRGSRYTERTGLMGQTDAQAFLRKVMPDNSREHFIAVYLDGRHSVVGYSVLTGVANACYVHPREVFQPAILLGAVAVLVSHNHPSGSSDPSNEDNELTKALKNASEILGLKFLDHIIMGDAGVFYSYANYGLV